MVKTVAFLKPSGKIRNIAIKYVNKKVACITAFRHIRDEADTLLNESSQTCMSKRRNIQKGCLNFCS